MMKISLLLIVCFIGWSSATVHGQQTQEDHQTNSPQVEVVTQAILYVLSPEAGLTHQQASTAIYWIVRTASEVVPNQTPEIASMAMHAVQHSAEIMVIARKSAPDNTDAAAARKLSAAVSTTVAVTFYDYIKQIVKGAVEGPALGFHDVAMLQSIVTAVTTRLVMDMSMQVALTKKLTSSGNLTADTSLPIDNGKVASVLTRDVCRMMAQAAQTSGFQPEVVHRVFQTAQAKCFEVGRNKAAQHFTDRTDTSKKPSGSGLAAKIVTLSAEGASTNAIQFYQPCPIITALKQLKSQNKLSSISLIRDAIRKAIKESL
jgi:hypothetical protein